MNYEACKTIESGSKIVVREKRSSFELINENNREIEKIQVDDCLIGGSSERCDWLLVVKCGVDIAHFVELKGCDLEKAISQLGATLIATSGDYREAEKKCYVVTTRVPKHGPSVQKRAKAFYKKHAVPLVVKNIHASVKVTC